MPGCLSHSEAGSVGEGLSVGQFRLQMLPGSVPGGPFRGNNPNSLKESNCFQKGKECSWKDRRRYECGLGAVGGPEAQIAPNLDVTRGVGGKSNGVRLGSASTFYLGNTLRLGVRDLRLATFPSCSRKVATKQPTVGCLEARRPRKPQDKEN